MECVICCNTYNNSKHTKISCPYCDFTACRNCCERYIIDNEYSSCMNPNKNSQGQYICNKEWSRKFITDNFTKTWINNAWKNMLTKVSVDQEKALFPATIGVIEQQKELTKVKNRINDINNLISQLNREKSNLQIEIRNGGSVQTTGSTFCGRKCPDSECKGFLNSVWKCGICEKWTCPNCNVIKGYSRDSTHECNEDDVATARLLKSDTKPCPKCNVLIHKIEGCDQMWCTACHTGFSWNRGTIETQIHNPHYYEYMRRNGNIQRNVGDIVCGRDITDYRISNWSCIWIN